MSHPVQWRRISTWVCWLLLALLLFGVANVCCARLSDSLPVGLIVLAGPLAGADWGQSWWLEAGIVLLYVCLSLYVLGRCGRSDCRFPIIGLALGAAWVVFGFLRIAMLG